jgi:hypothetical protein
VGPGAWSANGARALGTWDLELGRASGWQLSCLVMDPLVLGAAAGPARCAVASSAAHGGGRGSKSNRGQETDQQKQKGPVGRWEGAGGFGILGHV